MNTLLSIIKIALVALATTGIVMLSACKAEQAMDISLSAKSSYKVKDAIFVTLSITNKTNQDVQFLKWGTPFESMPTRDMFSVQRGDGSLLPYQGPMVKRGKPEPSDYILIKAGETLKTSMDISKAYGINASGTYRVQYKESYPAFKSKLLTNENLTLPPTNSVLFEVID